MSAIETENLTKRFGEVSAARDLDLTVEEGEIYGFLGPNGAGKSTTINVGKLSRTRTYKSRIFETGVWH